jgi:hypothetical protein
MIVVMKSKLAAWICRMLLVLALLAPAVAMARTEQPEREPIDARLEGYSENVSLDEHSNGLTWFILIILGVILFAGLFKDAKRSHLD